MTFPQFPGTRGCNGAEILIVGEAYGATEEQKNAPFMGESGKELDRMLREAGIDPDRCYYSNVVNRRPPRNEITEFLYSTEEAKSLRLEPYKGLYPREEILTGIKQLEELIEHLRPRLIIGLGNFPAWALTDNCYSIVNLKKKNCPSYKVPGGITSWRGSQLYTTGGVPFLPTYHPAAILRQWSWRNAAVHDLRARPRKVFAGQWDDPPRDFIIRPSVEQVLSTLNMLIAKANAHALAIAVDIETSQKQITCLGLAWSDREAMCIPFFSESNWNGYWSEQEELAIVSLLRGLLEHPRVAIIGQNFIYDWQYLFFFWQIRVRYMHDTMLAHHVCWPGTPASLDYISSLYCDFHRYWKDDVKESTYKDEYTYWTYNCRDCVVTFEAMTELERIIKHLKLETQYAIQMARILNAGQMMLRGTRIDLKKRQEESIILTQAVEDIQVFLENSLPHELYERKKKASAFYSSTKQLKEIFYEVLNFNEINNHKTGNPTVDDDALERLSMIEPAIKPFADKIREWRSLSVFGDFISMKLGPDLRARSSFSPTTETFRYRSAGDVFGFGRNLQNIPKGHEED